MRLDPSRGIAILLTMHIFLRRTLSTTLLALFLGTTVCSAALVWRPGEGWTDEKGSDISASSSRDQLELGKELEKKGNIDDAYKAYKGLVRRWPLSFFSPEAQFRMGQIEEQKGDFWRAYKSYQKMLEKYPSSSFFEQALEREYAIGNLYLAGEPQRLWKIPLGPSMEKTVEIYETVIKNAPYGKFAPQAQFKIGLAHENEKKFNEAVKAYNTIIDKYPGNDIVDDAQFQIGYAWYRASSEPEYDQSAAEKAIEAFQDFMVRYPNSEKTASAKSYIEKLQGRRVQGSFNIAQFYEKQGNIKAAFIYYNEVVRENPDSKQASQAKLKIDQLRPMVEAQKNAGKTETVSNTTPPAPNTPPANTQQ
jgi:outer membrane protein assembly factor BamD